MFKYEVRRLLEVFLRFELRSVELFALTADAANQTADDADGEQEQCHQHANAEWTCEELNQGAAWNKCDISSTAKNCKSFPLTDVGTIDVWLKFLSEFWLIREQFSCVELIGNFVSSEVVNHALSLFRLVGVVVVQKNLNGRVNCVIYRVLDDVAFDECDWANSDESYKNDFAKIPENKFFVR